MGGVTTLHSHDNFIPGSNKWYHGTSGSRTLGDPFSGVVRVFDSLQDVQTALLYVMEMMLQPGKRSLGREGWYLSPISRKLEMEKVGKWTLIPRRMRHSKSKSPLRSTAIIIQNFPLNEILYLGIIAILTQENLTYSSRVSLKQEKATRKTITVCPIGRQREYQTLLIWWVRIASLSHSALTTCLVLK